MVHLWNLVDKWNISIQQALLLFVCIAALVIGICIVMAVKVRRARKNRLVNIGDLEMAGEKWPEPKAVGWGPIKKVLMSSVRWSSANKWGESRSCASRREKARPLLVQEGLGERRSVRWQSRRDLVSSVWQRPILMGEKCELPRFSGLILYDERGRPLDEHSITEEMSNGHQEHTVARTTLRELL